MKIKIYERVRYIGPSDCFERIKPSDVGYVIEDYGDGSYEVEFSEPDGVTRAQEALPEKFLSSAEN